jgi:hypothetical protein
LTLPANDAAVPVPDLAAGKPKNPPFRHRADSVEIRVLMLLKQGTTATGIVVARSSEITVED